MDLQYFFDPYACVMYIVSYMFKSERSMGELLKQVSNKFNGEQIRSQLRCLGSVFLTIMKPVLNSPNFNDIGIQHSDGFLCITILLPLEQLSRSSSRDISS